MIKRWRQVGAALGVMLATAGVAVAEGPQPLFVIQRSLNTNEVHYDAQVGENGKLKADEAVVVYWINHETGGRRGTLNWLDRKVYGFTISQEAGGESFWMVIAPYKVRAIQVYMKAGQARAEVVIDGEPAYLRKIYIDVTRGFWLPTVNYFELIGEDKTTGQPRREKIIPK
jgi:hypothetical protein